MSVWVAIHVSGAWFGRVRVVDLEPWGLRFHQLRELELWRLVTAQLVHVKQPHMLGDVFCLGLVGAAVERHLGGPRLFAIWLVGGAIAMLLSTLTVPAPWNLGTGASQAVMAIAGAGLWLAFAGIDRSRFLLGAVAFAIALAFAIDIVHVGYPKLGHVAGVMAGWLVTGAIVRANRHARGGRRHR